MRNLLENFVDDPEALVKKTRAKLKKVLALELEDHQIRRSLTPKFEAMAQKSLRKISAPTTTNIRTRPEVNVGDNGFELKPALITMVQANQFCGKAHNKCTFTTLSRDRNTFTIKGVPRDAILLHLFPFSLLGKAKQ
jgi:hypothetical protein